MGAVPIYYYLLIVYPGIRLSVAVGILLGFLYFAVFIVHPLVVFSIIVSIFVGARVSWRARTKPGIIIRIANINITFLLITVSLLFFILYHIK